MLFSGCFLGLKGLDGFTSEAFAQYFRYLVPDDLI